MKRANPGTRRGVVQSGRSYQRTLERCIFNENYRLSLRSIIYHIVHTRAVMELPKVFMFMEPHANLAPMIAT